VTEVITLLHAMIALRRAYTNYVVGSVGLLKHCGSYLLQGAQIISIIYLQISGLCKASQINMFIASFCVRLAFLYTLLSVKTYIQGLAIPWVVHVCSGGKFKYIAKRVPFGKELNPRPAGSSKIRLSKVKACETWIFIWFARCSQK